MYSTNCMLVFGECIDLWLFYSIKKIIPLLHMRYASDWLCKADWVSFSLMLPLGTGFPYLLGIHLGRRVSTGMSSALALPADFAAAILGGNRLGY